MIKSIEEGRKSDGNRSIADKIIRKLNELRLESRENHSRWLWELMQNAKDSILNESKVNVNITINNDGLIFEHDAGVFTELDVRGIINQITSKENISKTERKRTGKFGTGFLTTNLLSKIVELSSVVRLNSGEYYSFKTKLDRNGNTSDTLIKNLESAWNDFHASTEGSVLEPKEQDRFHTKFVYFFENNNQKENALKALDDIDRLLPFVLVFNEEFEKVNINNEINSYSVEYTATIVNEGFINEHYVTKIASKQSEPIEFKICTKSEGDNTIAFQERDQKLLISLDGIPKIFCDYPLIGSEDFSFPIVMNSKNFNPLTERTGIYLSGTETEAVENKEIISTMTSLYEKLLEEGRVSLYENSFELLDTRIKNSDSNIFDLSWFKSNVQSRIRKAILENIRVRNNDGNLIPLTETLIVSPQEEDSSRYFIYNTLSRLKNTKLVNNKSNEGWRNIVWDDIATCGFDTICEELQNIGKFETYKLLFSNNQEALSFINKVFAEVSKNIGLPKLKKYRMFPDQNLNFRSLSELQNDKILDNDFKAICRLLGFNIKNKLLLEGVEVSAINGNMTYGSINSRIVKIIENIDSFENSTKAIINSDLTNTNSDTKTQVFERGEEVDIGTFKAFNNSYCIKSKLTGQSYDVDIKFLELLPTDATKGIRRFCEWMEQNREIANEYFKTLYRKKEKLLVETIGDKINLFKVMSSSVDFKTLAEVSEAIELDPSILERIRQLKREKQEEIERNEIGEQVEELLRSMLQEFGYTVELKKYGSDLKLQVEHTKMENIDIEVKYKADGDYFRLTPHQSDTAIKMKNRYFVFTVDGKLKDMDREHLLKNGKFIPDIDKKLNDISRSVGNQIENLELLSAQNDKVSLSIDQNLIYKFKVPSKEWGVTYSVDEFVRKLK